eukprot:TRINITY_DN50494_c0_g1_i1.p1 TRINITY_DN50494_c0_g1~~TRINITY_DN50494_c0_g1_i1.p1  ORF type:complete len:388 (+),score=70.96 TRINITY_DN50494_c0_g1_i1:68-1231(+)
MDQAADPNPFAGPFAHVLSATRLHFPESETSIPPKTEEHLRNYVASVRRVGVPAAIAVKSHAEEVQRICSEVAPDFHVCVLHVPCWGAFVPALNALLRYATTGHHCLASGAHHKFQYILYQSLETICTREVLQLLLEHGSNRHTLVVGPVLNGHDFDEGEQVLNGRTSPWNTLALWNVRMLSITGFLHIAEGLPEIDLGDGIQSINTEAEELQRSVSHVKRVIQSATLVPAGVEEVSAIALLQNLRGPHRAQAFLLRLPQALVENMSWTADWGDDERRRKWHEEKMKSKVARPKRQLQELFRQTSSVAEALLATPSDHDETEPEPEMYGTVMHLDLARVGEPKAATEDSAHILKTKIKQAAFANRFDELETLLQQLRSLEQAICLET